MLKFWGLAMTISVLAAGPAWAENSCGAPPIPPAIPTAAEIGQKPPVEAQKIKHQAFQDIQGWKEGLKDYLACMNSDLNSTKHDLAEAKGASKPDQDKIKRLQASLDANTQAYNSSVDNDERTVNNWNALSTAYCARTDTDKTSCPKH